MATINIEIDEILKDNFNSICEELGVTISSVVTLLAQKMVQEKQLPFTIQSDIFYSQSNMNALYDSICQMEHGIIVEKTLEELDQMTNE